MPLTEMKVHQAIDRLVAADADLATTGSHKIHRELGLKGSLTTVVKYMRTYPGHPSSPSLSVTADIAADVSRAVADALESMASQIATAKAELMLEIAHLAKRLEDATRKEQTAAAEATADALRLSLEVKTLKRDLKLVESELDLQGAIAKNHRDAAQAYAKNAIVRANLSKPA